MMITINLIYESPISHSVIERFEFELLIETELNRFELQIKIKI